MTTIKEPVHHLQSLGCVHLMFEMQVRLLGDQTAATYGPDALTYSELNAWSNAICRAMRRRGIGRGSVVGIASTRCLATPAMVTARF